MINKNSSNMYVECKGTLFSWARTVLKDGLDHEN